MIDAGADRVMTSGECYYKLFSADVLLSWLDKTCHGQDLVLTKFHTTLDDTIVTVGMRNGNTDNVDEVLLQNGRGILS